MRYSVILVSCLACLILGSVITLAVIGGASLTLRATSGNNRYQVIADNNKVFRIDTQTGKVWIFDEEGFDIASAKYLEERGLPPIPEEKREQIRRDGYELAMPSHWKEVPDSDVGQSVQLRRIPARKQ